MAMTFPMWSPFAALAVVCTMYPRPRWTRNIEWVIVGALAYMIAVWALIALVVWWFVW